MSAPRKITTVRRIGSGRRDNLTAETTMSMGYVDANTYRHDDVVQELVRAGSNMHAFVDLYGDEAMRSAAAEWRAALAKIAQEG